MASAGNRSSGSDDTELSPQARNDLLTACAQLFAHQRAADQILNEIGFPLNNRPQFVNNAARSFWQDIFAAFDTGIISGPYGRLIRVVSRAYPGNAALGALLRPDQYSGHAFISYVREDSTAVNQLQWVLEAVGVPVWRDTAELWPGEDWKAKIQRAITNDALVFLACFSRNGLAREVSYQNEELNLAIEQLRKRNPRHPWLIPIRLDECSIPDWNIGAGRTLASIQHVDLFGDRYDAQATRLTEAVLRILGRRAQHAPVKPHTLTRTARAETALRLSSTPGSKDFNISDDESDLIETLESAAGIVEKVTSLRQVARFNDADHVLEMVGRLGSASWCWRVADTHPPYDDGQHGDLDQHATSHQNCNHPQWRGESIFNLS